MLGSVHVGPMARLSRITVYPIKSLAGVDLEAVPVEAGGVAFDRRYAMVDADGAYVNGKNDARVFELGSSIDLDSNSVELTAPDGEPATFSIDDDRADLEAWLTGYFGEPVTVREATDGNFNDSAGGSVDAPGPTVVSSATLEAVASWYDGLETDDVRRRMRTTLEIDGVEAFWEDRLVAGEGRAVEFAVGDVTLYGLYAKPRCRVPTYDPGTGDRDASFVRTFTASREATFPAWADVANLGAHLETDVESYYYLTVVTRIPASEAGSGLSVGDPVEVVGERALSAAR